MQSFDMIMSNEEYLMVKQEYEVASERQNKLDYRIRKALSENIATKFFCCCLKVKEQVDIPWEDMTVLQRKFRVKRLWIKARLVYHFIRMKQSANEGLNH
jgi:hypothetical protein